MTFDMIAHPAPPTAPHAPTLRFTRYTASCRQCGRAMVLLDDEIFAHASICWTCDHGADGEGLR